jgi:hypothetical protein
MFSSLDASFSYNITKIIELIDQIESNIGVSAATYQVVTTININTTDTNNLGNLSIPPLEERIVLNLNYLTGYQEKSGLITLELPQTYLPVEINEESTREITSAVQLKMGMSVALVGWLICASFFTISSYKKSKRMFAHLPEAEKIMKKYKVIEARDMPTLKAQTLASMVALKSLVDDYESMLFHTILNGQDVFFTIIENIIYQYVVNPQYISPENKKSSQKPSKSMSIFSFNNKQRNLRLHTKNLTINYSTVMIVALIFSGILLLAFFSWITYYDITVWNKSINDIIFGARIGQSISLGIGMRLIHYLIASITLVSTGITVFSIYNYTEKFNIVLVKIKSLWQHFLE